MITVSVEKRVLCRTLLFGGEILPMRIVDRTGSHVLVEPFSVETAATVFEPRPAALVSAADVTDFLIDDLELILKRKNSLPEINSYLTAAGLYPAAGARTTSVTLLIL